MTRKPWEAWRLPQTIVKTFFRAMCWKTWDIWETGTVSTVTEETRVSCTQFRTVLPIILPAQTSVPEEETELDTRGDLGKYILTATAVKHSVVHNLLTYTSGTLARNTLKLQSKHNYFYFYLMSQNPNYCWFQTLGEGKILLLLRIKLLLSFFFWSAKITKQKKWKKKWELTMIQLLWISDSSERGSVVYGLHVLPQCQCTFLMGWLMVSWGSVPDHGLGHQSLPGQPEVWWRCRI